MIVALAVLRHVLRALWWLLRALAWLAWRVTLLVLAALLFLACMAFPWLRRLAWQTTLMAVGLHLTRGGRVTRSSDERQDSRGTSERLGTGNVPVAKLKPVSAQRVATAAVAPQRYGVHAVSGPGMLTEIVAAPGMGKTMLKLALWRAQYDGRDFCGLPTTRGGRKLMLTEMPPALMHDFLARYGFLIEPHGWYDRVRLAVWTPRGSPGWYVDVEYASKVLAPDAHGLVTDWPAVVHALRRDAVRRYDEICVDSLMEWMGSTSNDAASEALGLCSHLAGEGLAVSVLHHTPMSDPTRQLGGSGVTRAPDAIWSLYGVGEGGKKRSLKDSERYLKCLKLRRQEDAPDAPLRLELVPGDPAAGVLPRYRLVDGVKHCTPEPQAVSGAPGDGVKHCTPPLILTDRQRAVLSALKRAPERTATTPELAAAAGLDGDRTGQILNTLVDKKLVAPAGTGAPNAKGSKPPRRWKATPLAIAVPESGTGAPVEIFNPRADPADRLLHEALDG
jgi:hypothetical protein